MKKTVFSLSDGRVLQEFQMKISNPYTPINQGEQVVLTSGIYTAKEARNIIDQNVNLLTDGKEY